MKIGRRRRALSALSISPAEDRQRRAVPVITMSNSAMRAGRSASASPCRRSARRTPRRGRACGWPPTPPGALGDEVGRGELHHLAHADEQHARAREVAEEVLGELERRRAIEIERAPSAGLGAHLLGDREGLLEERPSCEPSVPALSAPRTDCFTCPRIWGSPSTIESRPQATRKAWRTAALGVA
jgi:hypothetical protein